MRAWAANYKELSSEMSNFPTLVIGTSMCSCDLFNQGSDENVQKKHRRKGWSKSKIERAIENRKKSNRHAGLHPELRRWLAEVANDVGEIFLFVHWESDFLNYEQRIEVSADEMAQQTFPIKAECLIHVKVAVAE